MWQRVLSLNAGMDLYSATTVVAAFMAGLGLGSLLGGAIADRISPVRALAVYALCEAVIGGFALISIWLLYLHYPDVSSVLATFAVNFLLLLVPTTFMGMTLPIISRGLVERSALIAAQVGRLYSVNTVGAALGAGATAGWWLLGRVGLVGTVQVAAMLNFASALVALGLLPVAKRLTGQPAPGSPEVEQRSGRWVGKPMFWVVLYGVTGFIALALEMVWFRLLNVLLRSDTYTFARLLTVYLVFLGFGAWAGTRLLDRIRRPDLAFLWLQLLIGVGAAAGGFGAVRIAQRFSADTLLYLAPLVVIPLPTFFMGVCFPLVQRMVAENFAVLGKRVSHVVFSNTVGSVLGTIATGFLLLDQLGTPATLRLLVAILGMFGIGAAVLTPGEGRQRLARALVAGALVTAAILTVPTGSRFWRPLHPPEFADLTVSEDGSCVTGIAHGNAIPGIPVTATTQYFLFINGELQNGIPFDDFHIRLGTVPALLHENPKDVLVIGLGAGSTPFGLTLDPRLRAIDLVEICGTEIPLLQALRDKGMTELTELFRDPRLRLHVQDGRKFLLESAAGYDLIVTDTLVVRSAYSGSLYSREFYQLARSRLRPGGIFAQWIPSPRTLQTLTAVFPEVVQVYSHERRWPRFMLARDKPLPADTVAMKKAFQGIARERMRPESIPPLERFIEGIVLEPVSRDLEGFSQLNRDLFPRDEYADW